MFVITIFTEQKPTNSADENRKTDDNNLDSWAFKELQCVKKIYVDARWDF